MIQEIAHNAVQNPQSNPVGQIGPYRVVRLSKIIDPATEERRCVLRRHETNVQGVRDWHTDVDIVTHLGTHVESPYHHGDFTNDVTDIPVEHYVARAVMLRLDSCEPNALIAVEDLELASRGRVREGDVVLLDSRFHSEPFVVSPDDQRPHLSRESAEWLAEHKVKAVGFGDGICIETNVKHCVACHDILLGNNILFIEVMQNFHLLERDTFMIVYLPLPIRGLDSSPVYAIAIENVPGF